MEDEDISERKLKIASILDRVKSFKTKYGNEDNWTDELTFTKSSADTTEHSGVFNNLFTLKTPEEWLTSLLKLESTGLPQSDRMLLNKLIDNYTQAVEALSAEKYSQNESYSKILVRFAELKAILDPDEARDQFQLARLNCKKFAFVHTAFAQFEWSEGNFKKSKQILQKGRDCRAVPAEMIELAVTNLQLKKPQLISEEDKENLALSLSHTNGENVQSAVLGRPQRIRSDSSEDLSTNLFFSFGQKLSSPEEYDEIPRKPLVNVPNKTCMFGRVPVQPLTSPEAGASNKDLSIASVKRQPLNAMRVPVLPSLSKPKHGGDDNQVSGNKMSTIISPNVSPTSPVQLIEDSIEMKTPSSVIIRRASATTTHVQRDDDTNMDDTDSTTAPYKPQEVNKEFEPCPKIENNVTLKHPDPPKHTNVETEWKWKVPEVPSDIFQAEGKRMSIEPNAYPVSKRVSPPGPPRKCDPAFVCATPAKPQEDYMSCFRTPVVKNSLGPLSLMSTPCDNRSSYLPHTASNSLLQPFPIAQPIPSSECIVVKGRVYAVLKQIGTGGSSKVFQVMDDKKQLYAVKYVNLEEADKQTIESYQNEISHLNKLQQHSDKIIRLYDYEITKEHIYMVMECGNIDLNSWLRRKKTINPWERKSYWKNMLEAVYTIHQHGIVHSDLKPANFLLVDGMLKLIDFGIANQIQPDVTSIVKDSQVGTINYMPPEAIKDTTSFGDNGRPRSKISPKGDVWSLGCILYCMTYGKTPFQHITNQITKLHAILEPSYEIKFPDIPEADLQDVLRKCLVRNPKERISIAELLAHPYVQIQPQTRPEEQVQKGTSEEMKRILGQLIGLNSPNSICRAAKSLYDQCNSGKSLDLTTISKETNQNTWTMK
ncbi:dual specificity protein kinase TTK isoform X2 [Hyla sarda]|nr:dual specificity protein kinase TTK isoform X2 [Hyla sarda]XP_056421924.1 dual specificity protein kinase TTK isoform X2 [Hyla sarda]XP_056421925.1 dual specificity protein kinase TTK isoform X2 [Hyla sarda]XP_056421926.1 dual specificity protein kinase TTK isoform X2 [Hyla sarda]XP_056421927.1 dual specificity protein kinase TTK isoform X2 [Hyla sarda]